MRGGGGRREDRDVIRIHFLATTQHHDTPHKCPHPHPHSVRRNGPHPSRMPPRIGRDASPVREGVRWVGQRWGGWCKQEKKDGVPMVWPASLPLPLKRTAHTSPTEDSVCEGGKSSGKGANLLGILVLHVGNLASKCSDLHERCHSAPRHALVSVSTSGQRMQFELTSTSQSQQMRWRGEGGWRVRPVR